MILLLSGCLRFGVEELQDAEMEGDAFQTALAKEYLAFAESEADQYDWSDADYFARKGLKAARGEDVQPEAVEDWDIPETLFEEMRSARSRLTNTVTDTLKRVQPQKAAQAYLGFDCWIEQLEETWQAADIESCRRGFFDTIAALGGGSADRVIPDISDEISIEDLNLSEEDFEPVDAVQQNQIDVAPAYVKKSKTLNKSKHAKSSHVIFFDFDSTKINGDGREVIDRVIRELQGLPEYEVRVHGHADRAGDAEYNMMLSKLRAQHVRDELVTRGVVQKAITLMYHGESEPKQYTQDGLREAKNRVVEIYVH